MDGQQFESLRSHLHAIATTLVTIAWGIGAINLLLAAIWGILWRMH